MRIAQVYGNGVSPSTIANQLRALGTTIRGRGARPGVPLERISEMVSLFNEGKTLESIGERFGVTRERVRQLMKREGLEPRRAGKSLNTALRRAELAEAKSIKRNEKQGRINQASALWMGGATMREVIAASGRSGSSNGAIANLRARFPELFPHRHKPRNTNVEELAALCRRGLSQGEIAKRLGYRSAATVSQAIGRYQRQFPSLFPPRRYKAAASKEEIEEAMRGRSAKEAAELLGYRCYRSLLNRLRDLRKREASDR